MTWKKYAAIGITCTFALVGIALATDPLFARWFVSRHTGDLLLIAVVSLYVGYVAWRGPHRPARRSRARRVLKWIVTSAGAGLLMATLVSERWQVRWTDPSSSWFLHLGGGNVTAYWIEPAPTILVKNPAGIPGWTVEQNEYSMALWPSFGRMTHATFGRSSYIEFPLWIPLLLCVLTIILLMQFDRRHFRPSHCQHCGYDLTGNVSGICPECGRPIETETKAADTSGYLNTR